ncbi:hypothetical protein ACFX2J_047098 [Malus domestica]
MDRVAAMKNPHTDDPTYRVVSMLLSELKDEVDAKIVVVGIATTCSQKIHNRMLFIFVFPFHYRNSAKCREGALLGFECLCEPLGRLFELYVIKMLPLLLVSFLDQVVADHEGSECAACAMMSQLNAQGGKLVLPSLLKGLEDKAW